MHAVTWTLMCLLNRMTYSAVTSVKFLNSRFLSRPQERRRRHRSDLYDRQFFKDINRRGEVGSKSGTSLECGCWNRGLFLPLLSGGAWSPLFPPPRKAGTLNQVLVGQDITTYYTQWVSVDSAARFHVDQTRKIQQWKLIKTNWTKSQLIKSQFIKM